MIVSDVVKPVKVPEFSKEEARLYLYPANALQKRKAAVRAWLKRYRGQGLPDSCEGMIKRESF